MITLTPEPAAHIKTFRLMRLEEAIHHAAACDRATQREVKWHRANGLDRIDELGVEESCMEHAMEELQRAEREALA